MEETDKTINSDTEVVIDTEKTENVVGNVKISADVVCAIAGIAAEEIDGVAGMYSGFAVELAEKLGGRRNPAKGVKIDMNEDTVSIDLYIVVSFGAKIPEISWKIQDNVKNNIETMTGLRVKAVNLHIEGVSFTEKKAAEEEIPEAVIEVDGAPDDESGEYIVDDSASSDVEITD